MRQAQGDLAKDKGERELKECGLTKSSSSTMLFTALHHHPKLISDSDGKCILTNMYMNKATQFGRES